MPTTANRGTPPAVPSVEDRLARLLDSPFLARVVPHLPAETLHRLIRHRGLAACGDIVTSATPAQLTSLLDLDLWSQAAPGRDDQFDADRFGEWLEVLAECGDSAAARTVAALDTNVVVAGLSRYLRVFDPGTFEPTESSDDEPADRHEMMNGDTRGDVLECEVGGYLVRAARADAWDAILTLLVALGSEHPRCFHAVMQGCRRLSNSRPEVDGLDDLLMAPEQHQHDVTMERLERRTQQGYATPADARAFLQMARQPQHPARAPKGAAGAAAAGMPANPIAAAYFRETTEEADTVPERVSAGEPHDGPPGASEVPSREDNEMPESIGAVVALLTEVGLMPERPRALLEAADDDPRSAKLPLLRRTLEFVLHHDEMAYFARSRELAFIANVLLAGSSIQSRPFTPEEASDAAACICNLGLECWPARWPGPAFRNASSAPSPATAAPPDAFLVDHDLVAAFEVGWAVLHQDVSLSVADHLMSTLAHLHCVDPDIRRDLATLRRALVKHCAAGTPWLARGAADVLAMLDVTAWIGVAGLLDECPILPEAVRAVLDRRTTPVSPTAFEFISSTGQLADIRRFMRALPLVLSA